MATTSSRSSGTKKASPSRSSSAKKSTTSDGADKTARKTEKSPARKSSPRSQAPQAESRPSARAGRVGARAAEELLELTGKAVEGITGLERTEDGWTVQVEVVELRRIPDTTDVLALYEVQADRHGDLQGYRRVRRYTRGAAQDD